MDKTIRLTYTEQAREWPPQRGSIVTINGFGLNQRFRVTNEPEVDENGTFSVEVEPA